ncbi:MAG TPA: hypothetical protein V6D16_11035 [Candidatus Obscuribacterales bacterium]
MTSHLSISGQIEEPLCSAQGSQPLGAYTKEEYLRNCSRFDPTWQQAIAPQANAVVIQPRFHSHQRVCFVGGCGTIKYCQPYAQTWIYAIEMELGPEPEMGRIGAETTILLNESEIQGLVDTALAAR